MTASRRKFTKEFKLKVIQAYESGTPVVALTRDYDIHANLVYKWTQEYRVNPSGAFRGSDSEVRGTTQAQDKRVAELERVLGRLAAENDFLKKALKRAEEFLASKPAGNGSA